jgi:formylglycine-generating enzyme required for sulfatase activity
MESKKYIFLTACLLLCAVIQLNSITNPVNNDLVLVKGGFFEMGDVFNEGKDDEKPVHKVTLSDFYICKYEVTVGDFKKFANETGYITNGEKPVDKQKQDELVQKVMPLFKEEEKNKETIKKLFNEILSFGGMSYWDCDKSTWGMNTTFIWKGPGFEQSDDDPVVCLSWNDAAHYCNWLSKKENLAPAYKTETGELLDKDGNETTDITKVRGYRLPTEAEWEYAARERGKKVRFGNGKDVASSDEICFDANRGDFLYLKKGEFRRKTVPVGSFKPNSLGLYDMSGNSWEWCCDYYGEYEKKSVKDPFRSEGFRRVIRGGRWGANASGIRVFARDKYQALNRCNNSGFRIAKSK